jgi:hypothetical protein
VNCDATGGLGSIAMLFGWNQEFAQDDGLVHFEIISGGRSPNGVCRPTGTLSYMRLLKRVSACITV